MNENYRESHVGEGKGRSYNEQFTENKYRSVLWNLERQFLDDILTRFFTNTQIKHLDFACGTGRIISHIENRTEESIGVDVSPAMIEVAREKVRLSEIILADITTTDIFPSKTFNLITAFRFFPNAEEELRNEAMSAIVKLLDTNGYVVFNNHKNLFSTRNRLARIVGRGRTNDPTLDDVYKFVNNHGMQIKHIYHTGVMPSSEKKLILPKPILLPVERVLSKIPTLRHFGENLVFVCSR